MQCLGIKAGGKFCSKKAKRTGYCDDCDPNRDREYELELKKQRREEAARLAARQAKIEQKNEILSQQLKDAILEIKDIEGLRLLELKVLELMLNPENNLDPRFSSAIVQLLKHQSELLTVTKQQGGQLDAGQREIAIQIALKMSPEQQITLLGDFNEGMKQIEKQAQVEAIDVSYKLVEGK